MDDDGRWSNSYFEKNLNIKPKIELAQLEEILNQLNKICFDNRTDGKKFERKIHELGCADGFSVLISDDICMINRCFLYLDHMEVHTHTMSRNRLEQADIKLYLGLKNFYDSEPIVVPI